jgi:hypothetical protein
LRIHFPPATHAWHSAHAAHSWHAAEAAHSIWVHVTFVVLLFFIEIVFVDPFAPVDRDALVLSSLLEQTGPVLLVFVLLRDRCDDVASLRVPCALALNNFSEELNLEGVLLPVRISSRLELTLRKVAFTYEKLSLPSSESSILTFSKSGWSIVNITFSFLCAHLMFGKALNWLVFG